MDIARIAVNAIALSAICVFGCRPDIVPNATQAIQVINKMASAYATCQPYYDSVNAAVRLKNKHCKAAT